MFSFTKRIRAFSASILLLIIAIGMIVFGTVIKNNRKDMLSTTAEIIKITYDVGTEDHTVSVKYTIDGTEYTEMLGSYSSTMNEGDVIDILYSPENPRKIEEASPVVFYVLFGGGALLIVTSIFAAFRAFFGRV